MTNTRSYDVASLRWIIATVTAAILWPAVAIAQTNCTGGIVFSGSSTFTLNTDYFQDAQTGVPCITLENGADLDLNGHSITCTYEGAFAFCSIAVKATSSGSIVKNTDTAKGGIFGTGVNGVWGVGVDDAQEVRDLRINRAITGIQSTQFTKQVHGNIIDHVGRCIGVTLVGNTSSVEHNLCKPNLTELKPQFISYRLGIETAGTTSGSGPKVRNNLVLDYDVGIVGTNRLRIDDNLLCNTIGQQPLGGVSIDPAQGQTGSHNFCCGPSQQQQLDSCLLLEELPTGFRLWP